MRGFRVRCGRAARVGISGFAGRRGFTLVELLVVIAVIAILAALVLFDCALLEMGLPPVSNVGNPQAGVGFVRPRHAGRWNVQFCDAHVQAFKTKELFDYHSEVVLKRWTRDHLAHAESLRGLP